MDITKKLIKYNFNEGGNSKKYIVIHDTGNYKKGAGAMNHYNYFNGDNRGSSAHYFVDDKLILQVVEDDDKSWHAGVKYGDNAPRKEVNNNNAIGIEICVNPDSDYNIAVDKTVWLVNHLMKLHNIPIENVVTHYEACLKQCPSSMSKDNWKSWKEFLTKLKSKIVEKFEVTTIDAIYNDSTYKLEVVQATDGNGNVTNYCKLRDFDNVLGALEVGYDPKVKMPVIKKK